MPPPPELPADDDGRVKGQDTAELLHFFKQAQATSSVITTQAWALMLVLVTDTSHIQGGLLD